jgi:hypothetical protein
MLQPHSWQILTSYHRYENVTYRHFVTLLWKLFGHTANELTQPRLARKLSLLTYNRKVPGSNIDWKTAQSYQAVSSFVSSPTTDNFSAACNYLIYTYMRRITTFRSRTDYIYDGGPIRL